MGVEQARDARLERIKFAATRLAASPYKARSRQPGRDRAPMKPEGASGLRNRQALAMVAIVDLTECLVIDHDRGPQSGSLMDHPEPWMSRECLDPAVANGRWYGPTHLAAETR